MPAAIVKAGWRLDCVLFDLDGTLIDTAGDLIDCCNRALTQFGFAQAPAPKMRPAIPFGVVAMLKSVIDTDPATLAKIEIAMLEFYSQDIARYSKCYPGIDEVLHTIESAGIKWGIVTNKSQRFTTPLLAALGLDTRAACVVSGDTTKHPKPHPLPMHTACQIAEVSPSQCVYIGDAKTDIEAGKNANMHTLAATYGYLSPDDIPQQWGAHGLVASPQQITQWLREHL